MKGTDSSLSNSLMGKHTAVNCGTAGSNPASKNRALRKDADSNGLDSMDHVLAGQCPRR